ncbi:cytochrome P450 [Gloeopeniophorella convolvens]|nr:cytochrome P450 [Gloeopeniophorella convolvens]
MDSFDPKPVLVLLFPLLSVLCLLVFRSRRSILCDLRGPESRSYLFGEATLYLFQNEAGGSEFTWMREYGTAWRIRGCMGVYQLVVADPKALRYILHTSGYNFPKTADSSHVIRMLTGGEGVGYEAHQRQRKILAAAFSTPHLKSYLAQFQGCATRLVQKWKDEITNDKGQEPTINVAAWFSRLALDIIGEVGLDFDFGALSNSHNPVTAMYDHLFADSLFNGPFDALFKSFWRYVPVPVLNLLVYLPRKEYRRFGRYLRSIREVSREIIRGSIIKGDGRDIMSVLLRANAAEDTNARLSDDEIVDQIATFLLAGHETASSALSWFLWELAKHPESAREVRDEIAAVRARVGPGDLSITDLEGMSTMLAALKESMRLHPTAWHVSRVAAHDDVIPLAYPVKTKSGQEISEIPVRKGTHIEISFCSYHRVPQVWGEDANEWNPSDLNNSTRRSKYLSGCMATSGGVRGCIGWRFGLIEMQALAVTLSRTSNSLYPEKCGDNITRKPLFLMVPVVEGRLEPWMGLKIKNAQGQ